MVKPGERYVGVNYTILTTFFVGLIFFKLKSWKENKNVPIVEVMDSPTMNDLYKRVSHHFSLKQNPNLNYLAPNQELSIEGWVGRQNSFVFDLQPKLSASKNAWKKNHNLGSC